MNLTHIHDLQLETQYMTDNLRKSEEVGWEVLERLEVNPIIDNLEDFIVNLLKKNRTLAEVMFLSTYNEISKDFVINNPYNKNIKMKPSTIENVSIIPEDYKKGQIFTCKSNDLLMNGLLTYPLGAMKEDVQISAIQIDEDIYSTSPSKILNFEPVVQNAKGKVLLFGLENAYLPYMWSLKEEVSEILVIEENKDLIDYYHVSLEDQVNLHNKITVVNKKALDVLNNRPFLKEFDYIFVNLWFEETKGLPIYLNFKERQRDLPIEYWNENTFYCRAKVLLLCHLANEREIFSFDIFAPFKQKINKLLKELQPQLKKMHSADEVIEFLFNEDNITRLLSIKS